SETVVLETMIAERRGRYGIGWGRRIVFDPGLPWQFLRVSHPLIGDLQAFLPGTGIEPWLPGIHGMDLLDGQAELQFEDRTAGDPACGSRLLERLRHCLQQGKA